MLDCDRVIFGRATGNDGERISPSDSGGPFAKITQKGRRRGFFSPMTMRGRERIAGEKMV